MVIAKQIPLLILLGILYFVFSIVLSSVLSFINRLFGETENTVVLICNICVIIGLIQITVVIVRALVRWIVNLGYTTEHIKTRKLINNDINGGVIIAYAIFAVQTELLIKVRRVNHELVDKPLNYLFGTDTINEDWAADDDGEQQQQTTTKKN